MMSRLPAEDSEAGDEARELGLVSSDAPRRLPPLSASRTADRAEVRLSMDMLRRRWRAFAIGVVAGLALAGGILALKPATYTSAASVFIQPVPGNPLSSGATSNSQQLTVAMETEASLVHSPTVLALAGKLLGRGVSVDNSGLVSTVPQNTQIVRIEYTAPTGAQARLGARSFAAAYLQYRADQGDSTRQRQLALLQKQNQSAEESLQRATKQAAAAVPPAGASTRVQLYTSRLVNITESIGELQSTDDNAGSVISPASTPVVGLAHRLPFVVVGGVVLGLMLGIGGALLRERRDDRLYAGRQRSSGGLPVWASVPPQPAASGLLIDGLDPSDPAREAWREVREGILSSTSRPCVLAVTRDAAVPSVVVSAVNAALVLREAGYRVAFIDASLEMKVLEGLGLADETGLAELLRMRQIDKLVLQQWRDLEVVPAGDDLSAVRDLLSSARMTTIIGRLRKRFDYVVIAAPDASTAEAVGLGGVSDASLLVARDGRTSNRDVGDHIAHYSAFRVELCGLVGLGFSESRRGLVPRVKLPRLRPRGQELTTSG